jgi:hypothetical protein
VPPVTCTAVDGVDVLLSPVRLTELTEGRDGVVTCTWSFETASVTVTPRLFSPSSHHLPPTPTSLKFFLLTLRSNMSHDNEELIDYEDENDVVTNSAGASVAAARAGDDGDKEKKNFSGIHSTGFR